MATDIKKDFLQNHFRKHDTLTLYKSDGTPVTIVKGYDIIFTASQYERRRFKNVDRLTEFCNRHRISAHPTITIV